MKNFPIKGIDVSKYQKEIDWLKVKTQIEFVIIRAGYGLEISQKDIKFEDNFESAKKLNIPIGIYWYAHATNESEAEKEAKTCLEIIKNKKFEFPIYYDIESQKIFKQGKENVSKIADKFCSILKENNYLCGIYSSVNFLKIILMMKLKIKFLFGLLIGLIMINLILMEIMVFGNILLKEKLMELKEMLI